MCFFSRFTYWAVWAVSGRLIFSYSESHSVYADTISITAVSLVLHVLHINGERNTYGVNRLGSKRRAVTELKGTLH